MQASHWTYAQLVKLTACELTQLIENLTNKQRWSTGAEAVSLSAANKRAKFVLQSVGNLLPKEVKVNKPALAWAPPGVQSDYARKQTLTEAELLAIVELHRVVCAGKFTAQKQSVIQAISKLSHLRTMREKKTVAVANGDLEGQEPSFWKRAA